MNTLEDAQEEYGWKLVHGDVFRPPSFSPMLLSVLCGTGVQVLAMTLSTITFAFLGFLSPANRLVTLLTAKWDFGLTTSVRFLQRFQNLFLGKICSNLMSMLQA